MEKGLHNPPEERRPAPGSHGIYVEFSKMHREVGWPDMWGMALKVPNYRTKVCRVDGASNWGD